MEKHKEIVKDATAVFMRFGIKSVTMDDIARNLGISKKTLYQFVRDKNDLVYQTLAFQCSKEEKIMTGICSLGLNAIDESFEISKMVVAQLKQIHPSIHFDLEKYHPEAWKMAYNKQAGLIYKCISSNLEKGIEEGLYRDDLNIPIVSKIYISRFDAVFDGELFPASEYKFDEVYLEMFRYHIRGIASQKGIKYLVEKVKKEQQNL